MQSKFKRILVTAALPYANGPIHLGHLAGAYIPADIFVRYQRLQHRDVLFISGSDEHGVPITITADKEGVSPQVIVDRFHTMNAATFASLGISFDNYSRTSLPIHHETSKEFFLDFYAKNISYGYCSPLPGDGFVTAGGFSSCGSRLTYDHVSRGHYPGRTQRYSL